MALEAISPINGDRIILESRPEGVYVLAFKPDEKWPFRDHLQDNWEIAKMSGLKRYGITEDMWHQIPDTGVMD